MFIFKFEIFVLIRDAEDAVKERNGYNYDNYKLRVEFPRGTGPGGRGRGRGKGGPPSRRSQYRVFVSGRTINLSPTNFNFSLTVIVLC